MVVGWVLSALVDSLIAFVLCLYLLRRRTGMKRHENNLSAAHLYSQLTSLISTNGIVNRLLLYSVNTGAVTS